jgi:nitroreductase
MLTHNEKGAINHAEYGLGLASQNLVLQAVAEGLVTHQMGGFDPEVIHREFTLPENAVARVAIAVGVQSEPETLGEENRIAQEIGPRERNPLSEFAFTHSWGTSIF